MSFIVRDGNRPTIDRDPSSSLEYGVNVGDVLATQDRIETVSISSQSNVTASGLRRVGNNIIFRVTGGTVGTVGSVTVRWTTLGGDTDERTLWFNTVER